MNKPVVRSLADRIIVLSPKPARVVQNLTVSAARPRQIENDETLRQARRDMLQLFDATATGLQEAIQ